MNTMIWKKTAVFLVILTLSVGITSISAFALADGAYVVSRTVTYANPETGQIVDGGTDEALGNSMCSGIVENQALVEQVGGNTYVTLGMGLASNVSNVRIMTQVSGGGFQNAALVQTGSCTREGDTCVHYRFQVQDASMLISPAMYVTPMGREVQFFIRLNMGSAQAGTGNFVSEMAVQPAAESETAAEETQEVQAEEKTAETAETEETEEAEKRIVELSGDLMEGVWGLHIYEARQSPEVTEPGSEQETVQKALPLTAASLAILALCGTSGVFIYRKKKGES